MEWISIHDQIPEHGKQVIGHDGKNLFICFYIPKHYEEFEPDEDECDLFEYDKETDKSYWFEGWYSEEEQHNGEWDSYWIPRKITHWMKAPELPK